MILSFLKIKKRTCRVVYVSFIIQKGWRWFLSSETRLLTYRSIIDKRLPVDFSREREKLSMYISCQVYDVLRLGPREVFPVDERAIDTSFATAFLSKNKPTGHHSHGLPLARPIGCGQCPLLNVFVCLCSARTELPLLLAPLLIDRPSSWCCVRSSSSSSRYVLHTFCRVCVLLQTIHAAVRNR